MIRSRGDDTNLVLDIKTLHDINSRQGSGLLIEVIAESVGQVALTFNLNETEKRRILDSLLEELKSQILERI